jgi:His/Glu/Gln/Arg/opine family amino acid ABC transporter permease subunit
VALGIVLGFLSALLNLSKHRLVRLPATLYISVIRGTPMVLQLMIIYFAILTSPSLPKVFIAIIAFGINSGAYVSEIFRAGVLSVVHGQTEAGRSLGLGATQTMRLIVLPQAIKNALPSLGNEFILLLKETSIVGYIGMVDLTKAGDLIRARTYSPFIPLVIVAVVYLAIVLTLSRLLTILERRLRRGDSH